jgi:hypothetical protein
MSADAWANPPKGRFGIVVRDRGGVITDGTTLLREGASKGEMREEMHRLVNEIVDYPGDYHGGNVVVSLHFPSE